MNQLNAIIAAVAVVVVSAVLVIGVLVPVIDSGSYDKTKVDNTPLTYEAYLQGSALSGADIAISVADGDLNITLNGTVFSTSVASMTYRSVLVSDGINVQVNNGVLDVYCPDGAYYADAVSVSKTSNRFTVIDSDNRVHDCPVPSYCYISIGTSDAAKTI